MLAYPSQPARGVLARSALLEGQDPNRFAQNPVELDDGWYARLRQGDHWWRLSPSDYPVTQECCDAET